MGSSEATVFIVDDDEAVRDSLGLLLRSVGYRARCYAGAKDFLKAFDPRDYGCLVLDIRMPGMTGLELQKHLAETGCNIPIVFITGHGDIPMAVEAVRQGAVDFLQKPFQDQELVDRINDALKQAAEQREEELERLEILSRVDSLTAREKQVMGQVVLGKANKVIAGDLGVSQRTVEIHRARVMEKMQANSLAHLVRMVMVAENQAGNG
jgi:two-component system, LuxR family, response regulator FixJ